MFVHSCVVHPPHNKIPIYYVCVCADFFFRHFTELAYFDCVAPHMCMCRSFASGRIHDVKAAAAAPHVHELVECVSEGASPGEISAAHWKPPLFIHAF